MTATPPAISCRPAPAFTVRLAERVDYPLWLGQGDHLGGIDMDRLYRGEQPAQMAGGVYRTSIRYARAGMAGAHTWDLRTDGGTLDTWVAAGGDVTLFGI